MVSNVRSHERTERHELESARPYVVERTLDEVTAETAALVRRLNFGVHEHDRRV